nr:cytochrome P450 83B1-like [Ipomoea trifida]
MSVTFISISSSNQFEIIYWEQHSIICRIGLQEGMMKGTLLLQPWQETVSCLLMETFKKVWFSDLMRIKLGYREAVVISSATLAKEVLKTHDLAFSSRPSFIGQKRLSYNALDIAFSPYSDYWREMKKICVLHLFSLRRVKQFHPIREDEVSQMINRISKLAFSYQQVNLSEIVMSLTSNIICRSAFGLRYDKEGQDKKRFHKLMNEVEAMLAGGLLVADFFPSFGWIIDKLTGKVARLETVFKGLDSFYQELIDKHLHPNRPNSMEGDIIDILLGLMEENSSLVNLTWDHIKAVLMRMCLGMALGLVVAELALANLLYAFNWELSFWKKKQGIFSHGPG